MNRMILTLIMMLLCASTAYSKVTYLHSNPMGSVVAATDETGKQIWVKRYTPYGIESEAGGTVNDSGANYGFATHETDKESGLVYMKARYYDPVIGRFYSSDPFEGYEPRFEREYSNYDRGLGGVINTYMYVSGNPINQIDPLGLWEWSFNAGGHLWFPFSAGGFGPNFSSTWAPGQGLDGSSSGPMAWEFVVGSFVDVGFSAGISGLSGLGSGDATSLNLGGGPFGKYGGLQANFVGGEFDGFTLGVGLGATLPISYTMPFDSFLDSYNSPSGWGGYSTDWDNGATDYGGWSSGSGEWESGPTMWY